MLVWEKLTKGKVEFTGDLVSSTITYWFGEQVSGTAGGIASDQVQKIINVIRDRSFSMEELMK